MRTVGLLAIAGATLRALELLTESTALRDRLEANTRGFRERMTAAGFDIRPGEHPIVPVMLYDEALAHRMADALLDEGVYVIGFSYPVVPKGAARIRVQVSAMRRRERSAPPRTFVPYLAATTAICRGCERAARCG